MKRMFGILLCLLLLTSCVSAPNTTVNPPSNTPTDKVDSNVTPVEEWPGEYQCFLQSTSTYETSGYYNLEANQLLSKDMGDAYRDENAKSIMTVPFGEVSYPMYYRVTTRPAGYVYEVDCYASSDSAVTMEFLKGTDRLVVACFMGNYPKIEGEMSEKSCLSFVESVLGVELSEENWDFYYDNETGFVQFIATRMVSGALTAESITLLADGEGNVSEVRHVNADLGEALSEFSHDAAAFEVLLRGCLETAYKRTETNPIKEVEVAGYLLNADLDGTPYYSVTAMVTYENATDVNAPLVLDVVLYPIDAGK